MIFDVLVIGGGPVGMWASCCCKMLGLDTALIEGAPFLGGQCSSIYPGKPIFDIPGLPEVKAETLVCNLKEQLKKFKVKVALNEKVISICKEDKKFIVKTSKNQWEARALIMSTGFGALKPNRPSFDNISDLESLNLVQYYFDNIEKFKGKICAVLGGGDSAAEWCINLAPIAKKVHLIHRREQMKAMSIMAESLQKLLKEGKCVAHMNTDISSVQLLTQEKMQVNLCSGTDCESIEVEYLIPCYGVSVNSRSIKDYIDCLKRSENGRILVDPATCASSDPCICAIGNACSYTNQNNHLICVGFGEASNAAYYLTKLLKGSIPKGHSTSWF